MPREAPVSTAAIFEQFLEMEINARERHEFVDGNVFVMAGGKPRHFDRSEKLRNYRTIGSLEMYVLLEQNEVLAEVYTRQSDGSWRHDILRDGAVLSFQSQNLEVPLSSLYEDLPEPR